MTDLPHPFMAAEHRKLSLPDRMIFCPAGRMPARASETPHQYGLNPSFHPFISVFLRRMNRFKMPPMGSSSEDKGFTLLDLLIVIIIVGTLSMMIVPQFGSMISESKINAAAWELVSGLEYAESLAIKYQRPFGVKADTSGNWFRVFDNRYKSDAGTHYSDDPPTDAYGVVLNPFDKTWYTTDFDTMDMHDGVAITSVPAGGELVFYPDGHSASSNSTFVISYDDEQKTITVDGITGRVSVQ